MYRVKILYNNENIELMRLDDFDIEHITGLVLQSQTSNNHNIKKLLGMSNYKFTVSKSVTTLNKKAPSLTVQFM